MNKPTPQQEAIYNAIATGKSHVVCEAVAGAGKTTTALGCAGSAIGCKIGFVAFNKHIATELQSRLAGRAKACTLHSLGFAAVRQAFRGVELDEGKLRRHLQRIRPEWFKETRRGRIIATDYGRAALDIARLCKQTLTDEQNQDELRDLIAHYGIEMPGQEEDSFGWRGEEEDTQEKFDAGDLDEVQDAVVLLLADCAEDTGAIDFDDMIWLPVRRKLAVEPFDVLLVDEAQDLSRCQQELAYAASRSGRTIPVGDSRQAIYGFSGADPASFPRMQEYLAGSSRGSSSCPLTVTFRCPHSHVALARQIVPQIEAADWAADGDVSQIEESAAFSEARRGDLIVARRNAPLVALAFRLIRDGTPAVMLGRDIGKGLTDLLEKMKADDSLGLINSLRKHKEREVARLDRRDAPQSQVLAITDRIDCLIELASETESLGELRDHIDRLFAEAKDAGDRSKVVTLASIHRAKGSESDRVMIVDTECLPMIGKKTKAWEDEQEHNLLYVALTRAKKSLMFAGRIPKPLDAGAVLGSSSPRQELSECQAQ